MIPRRVGCPIRKSQDHSSVTSSPGHIAGSNVLHRLSTPSHPPCALIGLTTPTNRRDKSRPSTEATVHALVRIHDAPRYGAIRCVTANRSHQPGRTPDGLPKGMSHRDQLSNATRYSYINGPAYKTEIQSQSNDSTSRRGKGGAKSARRYPVVKEPGLARDQPRLSRPPPSRRCFRGRKELC